MKLKILILLLFTHSIFASELRDRCFEIKSQVKIEEFKLTDRAGHRLSMSLEEELDVSEVTLEEANQIFNLFKSKRYIPFDYKKMGCESRAHEMVRIMDSMCLSSAKAFLIGDISIGNISWEYHVAPVLLVRKDGKLTPYVFDPSISENATPIGSWIEKMKRGNLMGYYNLNITNQYTYMPEDIDPNRRKYRFRDTIKTKLGLGLFKAYETVDEFPSDLIHLLKKIIK